MRRPGRVDIFSSCIKNGDLRLLNQPHGREYYLYETAKDFHEEMRKKPNFSFEEFCGEEAYVTELSEFKCRGS